MHSVKSEVKFKEIPFYTQFNLLKWTKMSESRVGKKHNFVDEKGVSYCVSREMGASSDKLVISVVDDGNKPNKKVLPFLESYFGKVEHILSKPWMLDESRTITIMVWHWPDLEALDPRNKKRRS